MTIEDLNKACNHIPKKDNLRYAWYTNDATDEELKDVTAGGKIYTAIRHNDVDVLAAGVERPRFYTWDDENGVTHTATNENDYNDDISSSKPILTSRTWYDYDPGGSNTVINDILRGDEKHRGWLASPCVYLSSDNMCTIFVMRFVNSGNASGNGLYSSTATTIAPTYGLRPVISFNINQLDISDTTKDGSESSAWSIK